MASPREEIGEICLLRGGRIVSSLAGAFGSALRETRLTALLGYIVALEPAAFRRAFGFGGLVSSVSLEETRAGDEGRSDIRISTAEGDCVIEAKVNTVDPRSQSRRYRADWRVLLTNHLPTVAQGRLKRVRYVSWQQLASMLECLTKSRTDVVRIVSRDLINHLEEHHMIRNEKPVEVYAREINEPLSYDFFLKTHLYRCWYRESSRLPEALYFAPHFGQKLAWEISGVQVGISHVAQIETVEVIQHVDEFRDAVRTVRGPKWLRENRRVFEVMDWRGLQDRLSIVFLGQPRLVFNPPIKKANLQTGSGWLSKRFFSFEELFEAWGK